MLLYNMIAVYKTLWYMNFHYTLNGNKNMLSLLTYIFVMQKNTYKNIAGKNTRNGAACDNNWGCKQDESSL